jgi:hypothetical protein
MTGHLHTMLAHVFGVTCSSLHFGVLRGATLIVDG